MVSRNRAVWACFMVVAVGVRAGLAEEPKAEEPKSKEAAKSPADQGSAGTLTEANIDSIMNQAVRNIAARYNLNDVQTEETNKLMRREVYRFLREHEKEVWPVIRALWVSQLGANPPEAQEELKRIGKAARPLLQLAKEAIFEANEEWRLYLTAEQIKVHDFDLAEMETTFEQIDNNFNEWEAGRLTEHGIFPQPQLAGREPPTPSEPPGGGLPENSMRVIFDPNRIFETLVEEFIKEYRLDEGQITAARSILEEFKSKANDCRAAQKLEFAKIDTQRQEALAKRDIEGIKKAAAEHKKLLKPVYALCGQMDDRLRGLLTSAQIERHAKRDQEKDAKEAPKSSTVTKKISSKKPAPVTTESEPKPEADSDKG